MRSWIEGSGRVNGGAGEDGGGGKKEVLGKRRHAQYSWISVCPSVLFSVFI